MNSEEKTRAIIREARRFLEEKQFQEYNKQKLRPDETRVVIDTLRIRASHAWKRLWNRKRKQW